MIKSSTGEVCSPNDDIKALDLHGTNALRARLLQIQADSGSGEEALLAEADIAVAEEKAKLLTPEQKIAGAEAQIEAMQQWLIQDGTYSPDEVDEITQGLSVEYDPDTDQVVVNGSLSLNGLTNAEGLTLPTSIGGSLSLNGLTNAEGLTLPDRVGGDLYLNGLTNAEGLTLPTSIGGGINFFSLTSAEGLTLPDTVGGSLSLNGLTSADKDLLRQLRPDLAAKIY